MSASREQPRPAGAPPPADPPAAEGPLEGTPAGTGGRVRLAVVLAYLAAMALNGLDATIVTPALPAIATGLGTPAGQAAAVEWAFLAAAGLALPAAGWAGLRWAPSLVLAWCSVVFAAGCVVALLAGQLVVLVAARIVQGAASGLMVPVAMTMAYAGAAGADRLRIARWTAVPLTLVPLAGPLLGGLLTDNLGWRSMFALLGVLAAGVAAGTAWLGRGLRGQIPGATLDGIGLALLAAAVTLATVALPAALRPGAGAGWLAAVAGALLAGVAAARRCARHPRPVVRPEPWRHRSFRTGLAVTAGTAASVSALLCAAPVILVLHAGASVTGAGTALAAEAAGVLAGARLAGLAARAGVRRWVLAGTLLALPAAAVALLAPGPYPVAAAGAALAVTGLCLGQASILGQVLAFDQVDDLPSATVLLMGTRAIASAWGVAGAAALLDHPQAPAWLAVLIVAAMALIVPAVLAARAGTWQRAVAGPPQG